MKSRLPGLSIATLLIVIASPAFAHVARRVLDEDGERVRHAAGVDVDDGALGRQQHREMVADGIHVGTARLERHVDEEVRSAGPTTSMV